MKPRKASPSRGGLRSWLQPVALAALRLYQVALRPLNPWGCKYYPSCSNYAWEAIEQHGLRQGSWLALRRLLRCRPGVLGGFDPVPDAAEASGATISTEAKESLLPGSTR